MKQAGYSGTPLLQKLQASAPDLTTLFTRLGPFSNASRPAFRSLGALSTIGSTAAILRRATSHR